MTCATILIPILDYRVDNGDRNDCVEDNNNLQTITPWLEVVRTDKRWYLISGVLVLGSNNAVRV